ncbi:MAG: hypothetical protein ABIH21_03410 [Patescibacteria group bacterium]
MCAKTSLKNDKYKKNRGGHSRWLQLSCEVCKTPFSFYQKDGPGILKRVYLDRLTNKKLGVGKHLTCMNCKAVLGVYTIYEKEKRPAYRLFAGAVAKKIVNLQTALS